MDAQMQARIDSMYKRDCLFAWGLLLGAWVAVWFVISQVLPLATDGTLKAVIVVAGLILCLFNTASIVAMVKHYREDKEHIYGLDIHHLEANRAASKR